MHKHVTIYNWEKHFHNIYRGVRLFEPVSCIYAIWTLKQNYLWKWKFRNIFRANTRTVARSVEKRKITIFEMYFVLVN